MLAPLIALALTTAPGTGLALSAQMGKPGTPVATYLDAIEQELLGNQVPVRRLQLTCDGARECLLTGAKGAGLKGLVAVTIAYAKKQTTLDLEGMRVSDGTTVAQLTFTATGRLTEENRAGLAKFARQLSAALAEERDAPVAEVPPPSPPLVVRDVEPKQPPAELVLTAPAPAPRSKVPAFVVGGVGLGAGIASGVFLGLASSTRGQVDAIKDGTTFTRTQADALAAQANTQYTVSLATGLAAGALITTAIILLVAD